MLCVPVMSQKRLEELRELNRETFKATGEYMTEVRQLRGRGCQSVLVWWQLLALLTVRLDSGACAMRRRRLRSSDGHAGQTAGGTN